MSHDAKKCCCRHTDARDCLLIRHPKIRRNSDETDTAYDRFIDEVCDCPCHSEYEAEQREIDPEPWEVRP